MHYAYVSSPSVAHAIQQLVHRFIHSHSSFQAGGCHTKWHKWKPWCWTGRVTTDCVFIFWMKVCIWLNALDIKEKISKVAGMWCKKTNMQYAFPCRFINSIITIMSHWHSQYSGGNSNTSVFYGPCTWHLYYSWVHYIYHLGMANPLDKARFCSLNVSLHFTSPGAVLNTKSMGLSMWYVEYYHVVICSNLTTIWQHMIMWWQITVFH